jgi:hypothetical protein
MQNEYYKYLGGHSEYNKYFKEGNIYKLKGKSHFAYDYYFEFIYKVDSDGWDYTYDVDNRSVRDYFKRLSLTEVRKMKLKSYE